MCWEDQKKARTLQSISGTVGPASAKQFQLDPARVRLTISQQTNGGGFCRVYPTGKPNSPFGMINESQPSLTMRIEDLGQALTGGVTVDNTGGGDAIGVTETIIQEPYP